MSRKEKNTKIPMILFTIMFGVILIMFGLYVIMLNIMEDSLSEGPKTKEQKEAEHEAEKQFFPRLDELYESGDYDSLIDLANSEEAKDIYLWNYEQYDFLRFYGKYKDVRDIYIPALDSQELSVDQARRLTEYVFEYYYRCYDPAMTETVNMTSEETDYFDSIRDEYMTDILFNRLYYTKSNMDAAKDDIIMNDHFDIFEADKYSDKYYGRYK